MIIILKPNTTEQEVDAFSKRMEGLGYKTHLSRGENTTIVGLIGDTSLVPPGPAPGGPKSIIAGVGEPSEAVPAIEGCIAACCPGRAGGMAVWNSGAAGDIPPVVGPVNGGAMPVSVASAREKLAAGGARVGC